MSGTASTSTAGNRTSAAARDPSRGDGSGPNRKVAQPDPLAGFTTLLRFMARRDRVRAPLWLAAIAGLVTVAGASAVATYSSAAELDDYASFTTSNTALRAMAGPGYGLDNPTQGAVVMNEIGLYTLIAIALMCVFLLVRHTRAEEESDRAELVRAAPVGRYATLAAACVWVTSINIAVSFTVTLGLLTLGLPFGGSAAFGAACGGIGLLFTSLSAFSAQVASSSRAANAGASGALGLFFVIRAVGDMGNSRMSWLSPLGWAQSIHAYDNEQWWVLILFFGTAIALAAGAVSALAKRDLGAGLFKQQPGPAHGSPGLATPFALALRLQRTALIGWALGVSLIGFSFGVVAEQSNQLLENEAVADVFAASGSGTPTEAFLATVVLILALVTSGFAVSSALRMRAEEVGLRADPVLALPVSRRRLMLSQLAVAVMGSIVIMTTAGLLTGVGYAAEVGDTNEILPVVGASLTMVPALMVLSALTVALIGVVPKWSAAAWVLVVIAALVGLLAETLSLPQWAREISPFQHVPPVPAASFEILPSLLLLAVAAALSEIGLAGIGRRDIARR